ncbi:LysR family transcriptional regulator [Halalkalibacter krulwichiae]|uniref:HTH-type transcriptional regulator GltC n=1 Tax=Halalkalibacter krulwichiae TaxID=199441 RepID=A0A1X9MJY9_9BACI|nr:LysR family transcriptional regulator [Halalkalibacter krulwichiae]ARK32603.1 HTH-type transcriptional regulator GltC [Halalkalibacter krulwichiae]
MDVRQLRYFVTVANEGQITRAAKKLNIAQPPLSHQLKVIEEELGTTLFIRHSRSIELTKAGAVLYKRASSILQQIEDTVNEVQETGEGLKGQLVIGASRSCATTYLPERINTFLQDYPLVTFRLLDGHPSQVVNYLEDREVELALVRFVQETYLDFEKKVIQVEPYVLFIPRQWDWDPKVTSISLKDLEEIPLVMVVRGDRYNSIYNECTKHGVKPNVVCECPDASILLSLVNAGIGATVMPRSTLSMLSTEGIRIADIKDCSLQNETTLLWAKKRPLSKAAQRFIETF